MGTVLLSSPVLMVLVHCTTVPVLMGILESTALVMCQSAVKRLRAAMADLVWMGLV